MTLKEIIRQAITTDIIWLALILVLICCLRLPASAQVVLDWDESVYFTVAQDLARGGALYQTTWDHKGPFLFLIFVPVIKICGNSLIALRLFTTAYLLTAILFVYLTAAQLYPQKISLVAALVYGLFFQNFDGLAANGELLMMLPAIIAVYCGLIHIRAATHPRTTLLFSGICSATAVLVKPSALFTVAVVPLALLFTHLKRRRGRRALVSELWWYGAGGAAVGLLTAGYFARRGALYDFYYACYEFNRAYVSTISPRQGLTNLLWFLHDALKSDPLTIAAGGSLMLAGALLVIFSRHYRAADRYKLYFAAGLTLLSLMGVYWGRNMYPHYFLQMAFPAALLIGLALTLFKINEQYLNVIVPIFTIAALAASDVPVNLRAFIVGWQNCQNDVHHRVADYVAADTAVTDSIFVLGGQPVIYFLAERAAPTKYFFWLYHTERWSEILQLEQATLTAFAAQPPKYIIYRAHSWNPAYLLDFTLTHYYAEAAFDGYTIYYAMPQPNADNTRAAQLRIGERITLEAAAVDHHRGHIYATFIWTAVAPLSEDYSISLQLLYADGRKIAQQDGYPAAGARPMTTWQPGEIITDHHILEIPEDTPPGAYQLIARVYSWQTGENLAVSGTEGVEQNQTIQLGAVTIGTRAQ